MIERAKVISSLLYGIFIGILKKKYDEDTGSNYPHPLARARGHWRSCSLNRNEPGDAIETTKHSVFDNETISVFITSRSSPNLTT